MCLVEALTPITAPTHSLTLMTSHKLLLLSNLRSVLKMCKSRVCCSVPTATTAPLEGKELQGPQSNLIGPAEKLMALRKIGILTEVCRLNASPKLAVSACSRPSSVDSALGLAAHNLTALALIIRCSTVGCSDPKRSTT